MSIKNLLIPNDYNVYVNTLGVSDGIYFGTETVAHLAKYLYSKYQTLAASGINGGAAGGLPYLSYCRIGNNVTVTFEAGVAGVGEVTASGAVLITTAQLGAVGTLLAADFLKLPKSSQISYVCRIDYAGATDLGFCILESGGLSFKNAAGAAIAAGDLIYNFSFSYNVDY